MHSPRAAGAIGVGLAPLLRASPRDVQALTSMSPQTLIGAAAAAFEASRLLKAAGSSATAAAAQTTATESLAAAAHLHKKAQATAAPGAPRLHGRRGFDCCVAAAPAASAASGSAPVTSQPLPAMLLQVPAQKSPAQHGISPRAQLQHKQHSYDLQTAAPMGRDRTGFQALSFDEKVQTEALMARLVAVQHEEEATRKALLQAQLARIKREEAVLREEMARAVAHAQAHAQHQQAFHQVKQQQAARVRDKQDRITGLENLLGLIFGPFLKASARAHPQ
mmetsp:Transcript_44180/g.132399  ORF Transcript_44180/g.132399 Transcript_44180/m.132399 type:complete len:278 (+) Transcript_44180:371-1204(+)